MTVAAWQAANFQGVKAADLAKLLDGEPAGPRTQTVEEKMTVMAKWRVVMAEVAIQNGEPPFPDQHPAP